MVTGFSIVALVLAALNAWIAYRTYRSQQGSEKLFDDMNSVLHQMDRLQQTMNSRELHLRKERARTAVHTLMKALRRQTNFLDGQWLTVPFKADPLEPVRMYETELSWIPDCQWKDKCVEVLRSVGPTPSGVGEGTRASQWTCLTNGCSDLEPEGQLHFYQDCLKVIDEMS